jgi:DNA-binding LacI/PurR family transcriptional regulator
MNESPDAPRMRATAQMVATRADVSRVAVSRAFNPDASLRADKRERILRIAAELNYTPDRAARALVSGRSHLVGLIVPDACSPWESREIDALTSALQHEGFATLLFKTRTDLSMDATLLAYMRGFNPDSVIAFVENVTPAILTRSLGRAVPIYVHYPNGGEPEDTDQLLHDRLNVLTRPGIEQAVALLSGYGARRMAYLSGHRRSLANLTRETIFRDALDRLGLPPPDVIEGDYSYDTAHDATIAAFRAGRRYDAIFAANDLGAFGAMDALRHELGLRVPGDIGIVGFDDIPQARWKSYDLTTVRLDLPQRVRALIRLILRRLAAPDAPALEETLQTSLVVRGSVA